MGQRFTGQRFTQEGKGWRLGWDAAAPLYKGLLAGDGWAIEVTEAEFNTFRRLAIELYQAVDAIAAELMGEERIACEAEADDLWLEAEGFPQAYSLRFILSSGRRCEGGWTVEATQEVIQTVRQFMVF